MCTAFAAFRSESLERTVLSRPGPGAVRLKHWQPACTLNVRTGAIRDRRGPVLRPEAGILARVPSPAKE